MCTPQQHWAAVLWFATGMSYRGCGGGRHCFALQRFPRVAQLHGACVAKLHSCVEAAFCGHVAWLACEQNLGLG
jgi:hypothetical protein